MVDQNVHRLTQFKSLHLRSVWLSLLTVLKKKYELASVRLGRRNGTVHSDAVLDRRYAYLGLPTHQDSSLKVAGIVQKKG